MMKLKKLNIFASNKPKHFRRTNFLQIIHIDLPLLIGIILLIFAGIFILYSASNQNFMLVEKQTFRIFLALIVMLIVAQVPPEKIRAFAPGFYVATILLLIAVLIIGEVSLGARRWLNLGFIKFQPSDIVKLTLPIMLSWYFHDKRLPPRFSVLITASIIVLIPAVLTAKQPDLGTAILIAAAGACVFLLAGINWRYVASVIIVMLASMPLLWHFMRPYQRQRVLTFLNPERDPLGAGYHIIQSKIAIGSGGLFGKGWLHGSQSHLQFLPEHATDFIFAVCGEELGLVGCITLIAIYLIIVLRGLYIASQAQDTFTRLLAGSLSLILFLSMFINIGMVTGILPVVGLPLPLVSYGGTSIVTMMAGFGILMSIQTNRKLVS